MLKECRKYWEPYGIYQLNSTANLWDVKNGFAYVLQFFSLISDGLGGVYGAQTGLNQLIKVEKMH